VRYRAFVFVFAAPQQFVAGNPRRNAGEPFRLVRYRPGAATPAKKFLRPFEGVFRSVRLISRDEQSRANRQAAEE